MNVPADIKARIKKKVEDCVALANKHFKTNYPVPAIKYDLTGRVGGQAVGANLVRFHPVFLMENLEHYVESTVPHEVAHCIDTVNGDNARDPYAFTRLRNGRIRRAKRDIHGDSWRRIMRVLGVDDASRCHTYSMKNVKTKGGGNRIEYKCGGCDQQFWQTSKMHMRMQAGQERWCRKCGRGRGQLLWVKNGVAQPHPKPAAPKFTFPASHHIRETRPPQHSAFLNQLVSILGNPGARAALTRPEPAPLRRPLVVQDNAGLARTIWAASGGRATRAGFISQATASGMKAATASTYYANLKAGRM